MAMYFKLATYIITFIAIPTTPFKLKVFITSYFSLFINVISSCYTTCRSVKSCMHRSVNRLHYNYVLLNWLNRHKVALFLPEAKSTFLIVAAVFFAY